jgi:hypothetical protein
VHEHHHVGVLLDGSRFTQVTEPRLVLLRRLGLAIELRQAQNRHLELAGQALEPASDLGDLLLPRILLVVRFNQLQVVDHYQPQSAAPLQTPGRR